MAYADKYTALQARGCAAADYRLSGAGAWPRFCVIDLGAGYKLVLAFQDEQTVVLVHLDQHDQRTDPYAWLEEAFGLPDRSGHGGGRGSRVAVAPTTGVLPLTLTLRRPWGASLAADNGIVLTTYGSSASASTVCASRLWAAMAAVVVGVQARTRLRAEPSVRAARWCPQLGRADGHAVEAPSIQLPRQLGGVVLGMEHRRNTTRSSQLPQREVP